ncbi:SDR family NAD(P)-dependent oxidoreductase [Streptomyces albicerus]|uniref:SDR family NAD(P)-dependent oxidoreductase n=1 Tax=Streptomyces albicerus TaxID=2569859 RepID=UPI00124B02E5|nr:SDR family NAD(P)-dependent oxidoreductase [Streptomyces albicerus]
MPAIPSPGTVLLTGAGRGLGRVTALTLLRERPDLHLVVAVRSDPVGLAARLAAETGSPRVRGVACDLGSLGSVRQAADTVRELLDAGELPPLRAVVANAGMQAVTATDRTADGFEVTFGTNVLGHHLLIRRLMDRLTAPGRIVLVGSGTHFGDFRHSWGLVPPPRSAPVAELALPWTTPDAHTAKAGRSAYAASKLATVHLAHELDRRTPKGIDVYTYDPGLMPGTGLAREAGPLGRLLWNSLLHLTRVHPSSTNPRASGRKLAEVAVGAPAAPSGSYLDRGRPVRSAPASYDPAREAELWEEAERLVAGKGAYPAA